MIPAIPLRSLPANVLDDTQHRLTPWIRLAGNTGVRCGVSVDAQALSPASQWLLDEGELLPEWAYHWLTLGAELLRLEQQRGLGSVLIFPSTKSTQIAMLQTGEIATALGVGAFRQEAGVILAWGIEPDVMARIEKPKWPLPCQGAVATAVDGLGMVCIASPGELEWVAPWVRRP